MPVYNIFGLRLWIDQPVAELSSAMLSSCSSETIAVDVAVDCDRDWQLALRGSAPQETIYVSQECVEADMPALRVRRVGGGAYYHLIYGDGVEFLVREDGERIGVAWPSEATLSDTLPYLLGPVLGLVIRLRGQVCLHASAVVVGDKAALLVGPMGAGKSSTALAFAQLGCAVLSDDVSVLAHNGECFVVQSGYAGLRLWPDMAEALLGDGVELPRIVPAWEKRRVDLAAAGFRFMPTPTPIAAIYLLNERAADADLPAVAPLSSVAALLRLSANGYVRYMLDRSMRAREFDLFSQVVQRVSVRQVTPHTDPSRLPFLCQAIFDDLSALPNGDFF